jgi:polyhydroxyalkanoate synthesis regulator phasin
MKTLSLILTIILFAFTLQSFAGEETAGKLTGKVIDKQSKQPISYATISIVNVLDSSVVTGVISNENGGFQIDDLPMGEYKVSVSFIGYKASSKKVSLNLRNRNVDIGELQLEETTTLIDDVVVEAERLKGEEKVDRTVYNLNDDVRKSSSDGIDVLKHIPAVQVDFQDNVSLEGQSNIQFYVNGILRNKDYVTQLDPSAIDRVEIISNPGAKYDADVSGVINILLKKEARYGVSGSVRADIPHPDKMLLNPSARLEYGNQKFRVYGSSRMHYERFNGFEELSTELRIDENTTQTYSRKGEGVNNWSHMYSNYGIDFFLSDKTSLNFFSENIRFWNRKLDFENQNSTFLNGNLTESYKNLTTNKSNGISNYYSLYLKHNFNDQGKELSAEVSYYDYAGEDKNKYEDIYADNTVVRDENISNNRNNAEFQIDYSTGNDKFKHDMGVRSTVEWVQNDFGVQGAENTSEYEYSEIREAAYYNVAGNIQKLNWQVGLRGEYSRISAGDELTNEYLVLLPSGSLQMNFEKSQNAKLSFRRKITRPNIGDLNPFETWTDSLHVWYGNPDLKPSLHNRVELSYGVNIKSSYISPKLYLDYTENQIQQYSFLNEDNIMEFRKDNIGKSYEYGLGLTVSAGITKWWRLNTELAAFNQTIFNEHSFNTDERQEQFSYRANGMNMFMLPKDFTLMAMFQYSAPTISYQRTFKRDFLFILGGSKNIGDSWQLEAFYVPFLDKFTYTQVLTESANISEDYKGQVDGKNIFAVTVKYNFNKGKQTKKINRSTEYSNDVQGGGM